MGPAGQGTHAVPSNAAKKPFSVHRLQVDEPGCPAIIPYGHWLHWSKPYTDLYVPIGQGRQ